MRESSLVRAALVTLIGLVAMIPPSHESRLAAPTSRHAVHRPGVIPASLGIEDDVDAQSEMDFMMLRDPETNAIPRDIRRRESLLARSLPARAARVVRNGPNREISTQTLVWTERGPNNVGGRTRAFAADVSSPTTLL